MLPGAFEPNAAYPAQPTEMQKMVVAPIPYAAAFFMILLSGGGDLSVS
jgi:hypothetical protein